MMQLQMNLMQGEGFYSFRKRNKPMTRAHTRYLSVASTFKNNNLGIRTINH